MKRVLVLAIFCSILGCSSIKEQPKLSEFEPQPYADYLATGWTLSEPLTVLGIEEMAMDERRRYREQPNARKDVPFVPFGFANEEWEIFKNKMKGGDEIRRMSSPPGSWSRLSGWEGYVLIRGQNIIWQMVTRIN
ncbi:hypothetical protein [Aliidiomarina quisquiliarum]|uniref:hypothetical protein n=1 Tax=Aliidiomarina quisquiliarum TaxID=2938947 RepID=UPI00208F0D76|nr:hypothetical protein [Aliidiomarina quisquiliarum]MCO4320380.1 hypothetical protein [Aliidiomarina quisquiliarum]